MCSPKIKLIVLNDLFFKSEVYFATSLSQAGYYIAVHSEC